MKGKIEYMNKKVKDCLDTELLCELLRRNGTAVGPKRTVYVEPVMECLVAIGNDHTASIRLDCDAVFEMNRIVTFKADTNRRA